MEFINDIPKEKYENFVKNHKTKSHFLQSYAWGQFAQVSKKLTPHYVGLLDDNKDLVAASLLLEKKLPLGFSYFYSPRGFVVDFFNKPLLKEFVKHIKDYVKDRKGIFLKIDPDIVYKKEDSNGNPVSLDYDAKKVFTYLNELGFKHLGFTKNFETMQPRYSFRIDMNKDIDEIYNNLSKTTKQRIKKAESINVNVRLGTSNDIETFSHLMDLTEDRKDFVSHNLSYYKSLYEIYNKDNKMLLFLGIVNTEEILSNLKNELEVVKEQLAVFYDDNLSKSQKSRKSELLKRKESINKQIDEYQDAMDNYGKEIVLNAHVIMVYNDKAWVLYAGNHNILTNSYANYKTYFEHIKYCKGHGIKMYDQFGTIGDLRKDNPRIGLHEFKKKFGGDYVEFVGEFDLVLNPFMYFCFTKLVPIYRSIVKRKAKNNLKKDVNVRR